MTDEGRAATLAAEVEEYNTRMDRVAKPVANDPALQLLALPSKSRVKLPRYAAEASYLSPLHCRICLQGVPDEGAPPSTSAASDRVGTCAAEPRAKRGCDAEVQGQTDGSATDGPEMAAAIPHDDRAFLHPTVAKHVLEEHRAAQAESTLPNYRAEVLGQAVASWPEAVSPQVLRTRLAAYKDYLRQENWVMGVCASCARHKRAIRLEEVIFPAASAEGPPPWLGWSPEEWLRFREGWCESIDKIFGTESYLQTYFEADARLRHAEQELLDMQSGHRCQDGFRSVLEAERWRDRVQAWRANMRTALEQDSVQAPGRSQSRWLLYIPCCLGAKEAHPGDALVCQLCRKCTAALRKRDSKNAPRPEMPYYARARGMWGGPEPVAIQLLSFTERRVIQLARVYTLLKRVLRKHAPWAKGNPAALPQYTTQNTVAYPNDPASVTRTVCLLPEELCQDMAVQFVSSLADAFQEPALQVSASRLRDAIAWLTFNCWQWMQQTKHLGVVDATNLGEYLEHLLSLYSASIGPSGEGVPRELLYPATQIDEAHIPQGRPGPADAAVEGAADPDAVPAGGSAASADAPKVMDFSSVVLDTGLETLGPLEIWNAALKRYRVLEECSSTLQALEGESNPSAKDQALREETMAIAEAAQALRRLAGDEVREKLRAYVEHQREESLETLRQQGFQAGQPPGKTARQELETFWQQPAAGVVLKLRHEPELLNSFDYWFWAHCFVDLFFRGDCREKYSQHSPQLGGKRWIKVLLKRADFHGWAQSKEFAACVYNILLRREQMRAVYGYVVGNETFRRNAIHFDTLTATDFVTAALASGDCASVRDYMRKKNLDVKVKTVLKSMDIALRDVEGSEAERDSFRHKFFGMRVWNGCSVLFFTLNPHDIGSPMLVVYANADKTHLERICLDWDDQEMSEYYARAKQDNPLRFHEFAVRFPAAAAQCVHLTFRMTIELLFNCAPPANIKPKRQHADGFPCKCEPGIYNFILGYLGIVEPQMRWTEHLHMLIQLLGFTHPRDLFRGRAFADTFRAAWSFIASIVFESQEAFAAYLGTSAAMESLRNSSLMPVREKQQKVMGESRARACIDAQLQARGLLSAPAHDPTSELKFGTWTPSFYASKAASAAEWEAFAVMDSNAGSQSCGNHVCRATVCHKGRLGKAGFCRLLFWYLQELMDSKGPFLRRVHGKELQARWDGVGLPPIHDKPPHKGAFKLERTHAFHFKMTPGPMLGPRCNHDLGILLKLPVLGQRSRGALVAVGGEVVHLAKAAAQASDRLDTCAAEPLSDRGCVLPRSGFDSARAVDELFGEMGAESSACFPEDSDQPSLSMPGAAHGSVHDAGNEHESRGASIKSRFEEWLLDAAYGDSSASLRAEQAEETPTAEDVDLQAWQGAVAEMVRTIIDHEFYCHDYASKEQPHAQGLLHTLHDSMVRARRFEQRGDREAIDRPPEAVLDEARRLLQRLVAATNRRFHKGMPSVYAYLLGKPNHYASHEFVKYSFGQLYNSMLRRVYQQFEAETARDVAVPVIEDPGGSHPEADPDTPAPSSKPVRPSQTCYDYEWRPDVYEKFPLYFFQAATEVVASIPDGTYLWHEHSSDPKDACIGKHPCFQQSIANKRLWVYSKRVRNKTGGFERLYDQEKQEYLCKYDHYRVLRLHSPWRIPVLCGGLPSTPTAASTAEEKGRFAIFMMMLFRPWRDLDNIVSSWMGSHVRASGIEVAWGALYSRFREWREAVIKIATPYYNPNDLHHLKPPFDSDDWWDCLVFPRLQNMELALARQKRPTDSSLPPVISGMRVEQDEEGALSDSAQASDADAPADARSDHTDCEGEHGAQQEEEQRHGKYPAVVGRRCGRLGSTVGLHDLLGRPSNLGRASAESRYAGEFVRRTLETGQDCHSVVAGGGLVLADSGVGPAWSDWSAAALSALAPRQKAYLEQLDADLLENVSVVRAGLEPEPDQSKDPMAETRRKIKAALVELSALPQSRHPSHSVVLEAASHLLRGEILRVKRTGGINVKQGRALMVAAAGIQHRKSKEWVDAGLLSQDGALPPAPKLLQNLVLILTGAAGTGKTTTIMVIEALMDFFYEQGSLPKSAPTITASRLLGGNTSHALYKLPRGTLHGKRGKLSARVLKGFRKSWEKARGQVVDEISVMTPGGFYQLEARSRTARNQPDLRFGDLLTFLCGDFLQLPPVDVPSLAIPWDIVQQCHREAAEAAESKVSTKDPAVKEREEAEHRGGCELWASIKLVVSLSLNMRSSDTLARILQELRDGCLSDRSWEALQDRVLGVARIDGKLQRLPEGEMDPRLTQPPFSDHDVHYVLHRHVLRVSQAYVNSLREATQAHRRLYVIGAADEVKSEELADFTEAERMRALHIANLRKTKFLPGHLPLYVGMRVLVFGKLCVRLGLMNGCECIVELLVLADEEPEFDDFTIGAPTQLQYMPAGIALRVTSADWTLPSHMLPALPKAFDRRGLFFITPSTEYFNVLTEAKKTLHVRRTQLAIVPATSRIVWNAQGESWHAVIADPECPPNMGEAILWLACYVMLSRAHSLEGLLLLRLPPRRLIGSGAPAFLVKELDRLLKLEKATTKLMQSHLEQFRSVLPAEILGLFSDDAVRNEELAFKAAARLADNAASCSTHSQGAPVSARTSTDVGPLATSSDRDVLGVARPGSPRGGKQADVHAMDVDAGPTSQVASTSLVISSARVGRCAARPGPSRGGAQTDVSAMDVDTGSAPEVEVPTSFAPRSPQPSLEFRRPHFEKQFIATPSAASVPITWARHREHVAALTQFLQHFRPQDLEAEVLRRRSVLERASFQCTLVEDSFAKTVSIDAASPAGERGPGSTGGVPLGQIQVSREMPGFMRFHQQHASANRAASGAASVLEGGSAEPPRPRNVELLKDPPLHDVSELLGYEDGAFDYVDHAKGALRNLGNTCYLNATLHVLTRIPSLRRWCASHQMRFAEDNGHPRDCVLCSLAFDLARLAVDVSGVAAAPHIAERRATWSQGAFDDYEQHDAHEAFGALLEACEKVDADAARQLGIPELNRNGGTNSSRYSTPFWKAFGGILLSQVRCHACGHVDAQYEMWHCLSIALPRRTVTIEHLLSNHWGTEPLRGEDDKCEQRRCLVRRRRSQETRLIRWPNILAIHLKRWAVISMVPFCQEKIDAHVAFENVLLVDTERPPYHLRGVVVHDGAAGGGHYMAYMRAPDNFWYFCDDRRAPRLALIGEVLQAQAYLLFYEQ